MFANFNGHNLDEYLRITSGLSRNIGVNRTNKLTQMRASKKFIHSVIDEGFIDMPFLLRYDLIEKKRALADILNVDQPVKLWFEDEPDKYYLAIPDGEISVNEVVFLGKGTIRFLIPDGMAHAMEPKPFPFITTNGDTIATVHNNGTYQTPIDIEVTFTSDANSIGFVSSDNIVQLGTTVSEDDEEFIPSEKVFNDEMSSATKNLWSVNVGRIRWRYDDGDHSSRVEGSLSWNDTEVFPSSYGNYNKEDPFYWHGPTATYFFANDLSDLEAFHRFNFKPSGNSKQLASNAGLIEINYLDADGNFIMGFEMKDNTDKADTVTYSFFVGNIRIYTGTLPNAAKLNGGFFGSIQMTKVGNAFSFKLARLSGSPLKEVWSISKPYTNETVAMLSAARIDCAMLQFKDWRTIDMMLTHTRITKLNTQDDRLIPKTFYEGDNVLVDGQTNRVYINGIRDDDYRVIGSSQFLVAEKGNTEIFAFSDGAFEGDLTIRERFL
ncbi:distal tail protein Dit [Enterococcus sp.]|uniref:distal tail protein Dit n=1 Tax=Enterococcus sp. TaxID=35783 RepID=UPI0028987694|nr:distal tail protein Dit [Enterococcus sp.]